MCGIYGVVGLHGPVVTDPEVLARMAATLAHRGPDGGGEYVDPRAALGVRRLRIVDRDHPRTQPFRDDRSGVVLVCNGEIYNAAAIRQRHPHYRYRSGSDVEPIIPLYLEHGPAAFSFLEGMYALALWDPDGRGLLLARDQSGEKPLFTAVVNGQCIFASEIQTMLVHPDVQPSLNHDAVADMLAMGYPVGSKTMFTGIVNVPPGSDGTSIATRWDPIPPAGGGAKPARHPVRQLDSLLTESVRAHLVADVPVGVFLSGGVDSALIAALAARASNPAELHTFAVGFEQGSFDERNAARIAAECLGTTHVDMVATPDGLVAELHHLVDRVAEPIGDPAVLPTAMLARLAKRHVGVALSGEGADELFGGYPTYLGHSVSAAFQSLPGSTQRLISWMARRIPPSETKVPIRWLVRRFVDHAALDAPRRHVAWFGGQILDPSLTAELDDLWTRAADRFEPLGRFMYFDTMTYLRALLVKIDRATMLASLEARAPYLHKPVVQFGRNLPDLWRIRRMRTKPLLKAVARRYLPRRIVDRRKRGLSVPVSHLMRTALTNECQRHLKDERFEHLGLLPPGRVGELVSEHSSGRANHARALWTLLVLGLWSERWMGA